MRHITAHAHARGFINNIICCRCIKGILADKVVVLATHQMQFLERVDKIFTLKDVGATLT